MGMLICPLCCEDEFADQLALRYHLLSIIDNVYCPQCSERFDTILQLAKHLDGMCGSVADDGDELKLESYCDKENKMNMEHCTQESTTDVNDLEVLQDESCEVEESSVSVMAPETQQTHMVGVTTLEMNTSTTGVSDFRNDCPQVIEQSIDATSLNDLKDIEKSQDEEVEPMVICDASNEKNVDTNEKQIYSCSVCDVTFTSISEHIRVFHKGKEVAIKGVLDKNKAVLERVVDADTYLLRRRDGKLVHIEKRIRNVSSAVHINVNEDKFADSQSFPLSKGNTGIVYHEDKCEQLSPNLKAHEKFIKNEFKVEQTNEGGTSCMDINLTSSDEMKKELETQSVMKNEKKSIKKLFSGNCSIKKNKNILLELCETIVKSPDIDEEEEEEEEDECSREPAVNNIISIFTCTVCQMEFGNMSMFKKHSCPRSKTGSKSMKTVCLKPEISENTADCSRDSDGKTKLQLVLQVVRCKFCSMTFNKMGAFRKHLRTHNTPQFKHLLCPVCRMLCSSNLELTKHVKNVHLVKNLDVK